VKIQTVDVYCKGCSSEVRVDLPIECPLQVTIAALKALCCPSCGASSQQVCV